MRRLILAALGLLTATAGGCGAADCRPGTLLLSVSLSGAAQADGLRVSFALAGGEPRRTELSRTALRGVETVEITFPAGYPSGQPATVVVEALTGGAVTARAERSVVLVPGCTLVDAALAATPAPIGDLAAADLAPPPDQCLPLTECPATVTCGQAPDGCGGILRCTPCQLFAVSPPLAAAGATLALEGTFDDPAVVRFPGGGSAPATLLGPHRATVVVPPGAGAGDLTVATGGAIVGPVQFQKVQFELGLGPLFADYEQANGARQMARLAVPRTEHNLAVVGDSLFVIGGAAILRQPPPIERASINVDGSLSRFKVIPDVLPVVARRSASSLVLGSSIYLIGGFSDGKEQGSIEDQSSIERATVDAGGTLSPFALTTSKLRVPRSNGTSIVIGNSVYLLGGGTSVQRATITPDGSLTDFEYVSDLRVAHGSPLCFVRGQVLYVVGGDALGTVESAPIYGNGTLGVFTVLPDVRFEKWRFSSASVLLGDSIYALGGTRSSIEAGDRTVERAAFDANGVLSTFHTVPGLQLRAGRGETHVAVVGSYLYVIGDYDYPRGHDWPGSYSGVERASIDASGGLSSFTEVAGVLPAADLARQSAVVAGRYLYLLGGRSAHPHGVLRSAIAADGALSPFGPVAGVTLKVPRFGACSAVIGRSLYLIGGAADAATAGGDLASVERATIADDGTLSDFELVPGLQLAKTRSGHSCALHGLVPYDWAGHSLAPGGSFYVFGGDSDGAYSIERADIGGDDALGSFAVVPGAVLPPDSGREVTPAVFGDTLRLVGAGSGDVANAVQRATFLADGAGLSAFSVPTGELLQVARRGHGSVVVGNRLALFGGVSGSGPQTSESAIIGNDDSLSGFGLLDSSPQSSPGATATIVGSTLYVIGGGHVYRAELQ